MKLLHIVPTYLPAYRYGGPIKSVHDLNKWLVKKGMDVTVYTTNLDGKFNLQVPLSKEVILDGVKVYYFPITFRGWQYSYELHKNLAKNIKSFDLVHITSVFLSVSTLGAYYSKKFKKPYIISPRGSLMTVTLKKKAFKKKIYLSLLEKRNLAGVSAIHFTSEEEEKEYTNSGLPLHKSIIIPNGLDPTEFEQEVPVGLFRKEFKISSSKKIVLFLSRISWKKGFDVLIPAFALIKKEEPDTILVIAGGDDEGYQAMVKQLIKENNLKIGDDVVFTKMVTGKLKSAAYKESDVFLYTPYAENFGMVALESMYFGLPLVMTNTTGTAVVVENAKAGFVVNRDAREVAEKALDILRNKKAAREMAERGRQLVEKKYSWSTIADQFVTEYSKIAKEV